jgi:hypothetical protein
MKYLYQTTKILVVDLGIAPKVWWFLFYILSQHLDHLQQLDNLEHPAHVYGQLTTVGVLQHLDNLKHLDNLQQFGHYNI